jgi:hypothetical protein
MRKLFWTLAAAVLFAAMAVSQGTYHSTTTPNGAALDSMYVKFKRSWDSLQVAVAMRPFDSTSISILIDSTALRGYGQDSAKMFGPLMLSKSFLADSLVVALVGAAGDTVEVDYRFGPGYASTNGGTALWSALTSAANYATALRVGSPTNGIVPAGDFLWLRVKKCTGSPRMVSAILKGRYTR